MARWNAVDNAPEALRVAAEEFFGVLFLGAVEVRFYLVAKLVEMDIGKYVLDDAVSISFV